MSTVEKAAAAARPASGPEDSSAHLLAMEQNTDAGQDVQTGADGKPLGKRQRLFNFVRKKSDDKAGKKGEEKGTAMASTGPSVTSAPVIRAGSPLRSPAMDIRAGSPLRGSQHSIPDCSVSPSRRVRSSSPSSSSIFERNVQDTLPPAQLSPAIPAHIQTEDRIPPVLEASSQIITDGRLNPDDVEIVMHSAHQPAAASVAGTAMSDSGLMSPMEDLASPEHSQQFQFDDSGSNYGTLDPNDARRLSFISFADVVQAEHAESSRDSVHMMSFSSTANRSPSPVRSPISSHGMGPSPPTSGAPSMKGVDIASAKLAHLPASPTSGTHSPPLGGDLHVETMRQVLRKTGSGDLSGVRSQPLSATSLDEERQPFR